MLKDDLQKLYDYYSNMEYETYFNGDYRMSYHYYLMVKVVLKILTHQVNLTNNVLREHHD